MTLILALRYWAQITIAILCLLLLFAVSSCSSKERDIKQMATKHKLQITNERLAHADEQRAAQAKATEQNIKALNDYKAREQVLLSDAASARDSVISLSNTLSQVTDKAATDANFQRDALAITSDSLEACSTGYSELAKVTDRLDNSLRATIDANRR